MKTRNVFLQSRNENFRVKDAVKFRKETLRWETVKVEVRRIELKKKIQTKIVCLWFVASFVSSILLFLLLLEFFSFLTIERKRWFVFFRQCVFFYHLRRLEWRGKNKSFNEWKRIRERRKRHWQRKSLNGIFVWMNTKNIIIQQNIHPMKIKNMHEFLLLLTMFSQWNEQFSNRKTRSRHDSTASVEKFRRRNHWKQSFKYFTVSTFLFRFIFSSNEFHANSFQNFTLNSESMNRRFVVPQENPRRHSYVTPNPNQPFSYTDQLPSSPRKNIQYDTDA